MNLLNENSIFIAGVPATGKTYFGNWLEKHHNYFHLDIENNSDRTHNLQNEISRFGQGDCRPLCDKLRDMGKPIAFNYGFPPKRLSIIEDLLKYGLKPVWFTASNKIARKTFLDRGGIDIEFFEKQMNSIGEMEYPLHCVFGECEIKTLLDDGTRLEPEKIYRYIKQKYGLTNHCT